MFIIQNGQYIQQSDLQIDIDNRLFQYGDGFFDTICFDGQKIKFELEHKDRIQEGLALLQLDLPVSIDSIFLTLTELARLNKMSNGYLKIHFFRAIGGKFIPTNSNCEWLAYCKPSTLSFIKHDVEAVVLNSVRNHETIISTLKSSSSLHYILAGLETRNQHSEEGIILDQDSTISEATHSNLFMVRNSKVYTPPLSTGCINGVARRKILHEAQHASITIIEEKIPLSELNDSSRLISTNVAGFTPIIRLDQRDLQRAITPFEDFLTKVYLG